MQLHGQTLVRLTQGVEVLGVFVGLATLDVVQWVSRLPGADEKVAARAVEIAAGGPATNAAKTFAALGGSARLVTALGRHPVADLIRADLADLGVEVIDLTPDAIDLPPVSTVLVTEGTGERAVVTAVPAPRLGLVDLDLSDASIVLADGHLPGAALRLAHDAAALGLPLVVDAGRPKPIFDELLPLATVAICAADFTELPALTGRLEGVAITAGGGPVRWATRTATGQITPPAVRALDTLGAGDVLHGAFCLEQLRRDGFPEALEAAMASASDRCAQIGLSGWLRGRAGRM